MTRDEVLVSLVTARARFNTLVAAVPRDLLDAPPDGRTHAPKDVVAHVTAYEELIVGRLRAARSGETTAFDRDREGWEAFNDRVWAEAAAMSADDVLERSVHVFSDLCAEVERLTDAELNEVTGVTAAIDPTWLQGRSLAELIGIDAFEHYPMHAEALGATAPQTPS